MRIESYIKAESVDEAYRLLSEKPNAVAVAGGAWLKLMPKTVSNAIDLSGIGLDTITETKDDFVIGSMVTLRELELYETFREFCNGIVSKSAGNIMGIAVRNIATVGGTIAGRYGFSDLLPMLMALDAELEFYKGGRISLEEFLNGSGPVKDILTTVYIKKTFGKGWFETLKNTAIDFPILNAAVTASPNGVRICIGARPSKAVMAEKAMKYINDLDNPTDEDIEKAADIACSELKFSSNQRGSAGYRKELCRTFVKRGLSEVLV